MFAALTLLLSFMGPGAVGTAEAADSCANSFPGHGDYCELCGPCGDGEGDCDPGQCASGLKCVEEGDIDHCRPEGDSCSGSFPGKGDYCEVCGPCGDGEGDCDPGQCASGLKCVEEGDIDHCRPEGDSCAGSFPGKGDYCGVCGPCGDGEGDCDPGQCAAGLECVEEGDIDHCRPVGDTCNGAKPGDIDYCAVCGPCGDGDGDCDPGQCGAGLTCVEEGATDHCRPTTTDSCSGSNPGDSDYCASYNCGPCGEGEGDCDPGQCGDGLTCVEEGAVDRCRPMGSGSSNFQVKIDGEWKGICCEGTTPRISDGDCFWTEYDRTLTDQSNGRKLDCPEGWPTDCECNWSGERMHGFNGHHLDSSLLRTGGGPVYPNYGTETCVVINSNGELETEWTNSSCPYFRLE